MSAGKHCPNCGAEIPAGSLKCRYCNFEVRSDSAQVFNCIQELQAKLSEADNSMSAKDKMLYGEMQLWKRKASIIQGFTLPSTKADLINLLTFAYSNYEGSKGGVNLYGNPVRDAWLGKAKQAFAMLKILGKDDEQVQELLAGYVSLDCTSLSKNEGAIPKLLSSLFGKRKT